MAARRKLEIIKNKMKGSAVGNMSDRMAEIVRAVLKIDSVDTDANWFRLGATSIDIIKDARTSPADPLLPPEKRAREDLSMGRAVIDACRPFHWKDDFPAVNAPPPALAREARERFGYLLGN